MTSGAERLVGRGEEKRTEEGKRYRRGEKGAGKPQGQATWPEIVEPKKSEEERQR